MVYCILSHIACIKCNSFLKVLVEFLLSNFGGSPVLTVTVGSTYFSRVSR